MNNWKKHFGIEYPQCKMTGQCCRMASPSTPAVKLLEKAAQGNSFARDFFSIFQPYESIEEVKLLSAEIVERSLTQAKKSPVFDSIDQVVFYHCRFINNENRCLIYEDRPQLCRDYPDTPFIVMPPDCAFESWSKECKKKYQQMQHNLKTLKDIKYIINEADKIYEHKALKMFLVSPVSSWLR